jgi:hypothetical protein
MIMAEKLGNRETEKAGNWETAKRGKAGKRECGRVNREIGKGEIARKSGE